MKPMKPKKPAAQKETLVEFFRRSPLVGSGVKFERLRDYDRTFELDGDITQQQLHQAASECLGTIASGDACRSETVRQIVLAQLQRRYGR